MFGVWLALIVSQGLAAAGLHPQPTKGPAPSVIAVIVPDAATSSMLDALNRLHGEATSVGFEIRLVERLRGATPQSTLERIARDLSPAAVVALWSEGQASEDKSAIRTVDIWFLDRASGRVSLGHLPVERETSDRAEQALAIGVVDFIRARMFDSLAQDSVESKVERPRASPTIPLGRYQISAGLDALGSFSGFASVLLPSVEASFALRSWLQLSLAAGGLGTQVRRYGAAGSVNVEQRLLKAGATLVGPALARRWYLNVASGLAMSFLATHGEGGSGYIGQAPTGSSLGVHCSGGVLLPLTSHVFLQASLGALWLFREQQIFIADEQVARTGHPTWLTSTMLGVMF